MRIEFRHKFAIGAGLAFLLADFLMLKNTPLFVPFIAIALTIGWSQFWLDFFAENRKQKEIEEKFPEFVRNFVGAVNSGMSPSVAVKHVSKEDYGALSQHIRRLSYQLDWAMPFHKALNMFAESTRNSLIKKAVSTVIEAESYGGNIEDVLESVTDSLIQVKKIKEERSAGIHAQVIQSYIIFIVFLGIVVAIQNFLIPYMSGVGSGSVSGLFTMESSGAGLSMPQKVGIDFSTPQAFISSMSEWIISVNGIFLMLSLIQALFAGLVIGKLAEGDIRYGVKHSLILMTIAFLIITFSQAFVK
ncbi:MAG: type II secretion system F family protein [Candidatus Woesearchaeota archaeon]|nr:type II secretion system F family protein [Candidatus Woesearchaeota archaeon]